MRTFIEIPPPIFKKALTPYEKKIYERTYLTKKVKIG